MNAYALRAAGQAQSLKALYADAVNDARYSSTIEESLEEESAAWWVQAIMFVRCVLGPLVLLMLLLGATQWNGSGSATASAAQPAQTAKLARGTAIFKSFHEQFATRAGPAEEHIEAF